MTKGLYRSKSFTWRLHCTKLAPFKHTRSHSESDTISPLSYPKRLVRKANSRRRHQPSSSTSTLQSEYKLKFDPYSNIPSKLDYTHLSPRVVELLDRGVDFKSSFLIYSLESHQDPPLPPGSPKSDSDLGVHLPEYKPTDFISPTTYSFHSTSEQPESSTSKQLEGTFAIYSNPLFETEEDIHSQVHKLVIKTPLKSFRTSPPYLSPPSSPPHSSSPLLSPSSSSLSSSSQTSHTSSSNMAFQPIV